MAGHGSGSTLFRIGQLVLAVLGLGFTIGSNYVYTILLVLYALVLIYLVIMLICVMANKSALSTTVQALMEVALGITLLAYTIYVAATASKDIWIILAIIVGFVLPAVLFITAYEKS